VFACHGEVAMDPNQVIVSPDVVAMFYAFLGAFQGPLVAALALIGLDVALGIASAVKRGKFQWQQVANFYRTIILPKLIGWVALSVFAYFAAFAALPPEAAQVLAPVSAGVLFTVLALDLAGSILSNYREIVAPVPPVAPPQAP
jgi:hypothetical protein